ncbi:MAG TPA: hypothetical protein VHX65_02825 [Pirellulales bacterium]|jgi:hypothetical protein|nr:hypothetical protein [Pirellulales bacterium]
MKRFLNNLLIVVVVGLVSTSASLVMAHGGGGHSSGGHSSHSSSGHSSSRSVGHAGTGHLGAHTYAHISHAGPTDYKGTRHPSLVILNPPGTVGGNYPPGYPRYPFPPRHRWPYHMHYPVGFWFGGSYDVVDADAVEGGIDVQFTKIEQLDAGDSAKNLAPAYRVWFHNNSDVDIAQPFDVAILASTDGKLSQGLPYANVRVDGIAADQTASVDIRLPIEAMTMASTDGQTAPYAYVNTIIDSQKELVETDKANNLSVDSRDTISAAAE